LFGSTEDRRDPPFWSLEGAEFWGSVRIHVWPVEIPGNVLPNNGFAADGGERAAATI